jgi:hypothetical protein
VASPDPEDAPLDLGPWLTQLYENSGRSLRGLAQALGMDRKNVRIWQAGKGGMTAKNLLAYLDAVGVTIEPPPPAQARSLAGDLAHLEARLEALEATVEEQGQAQTAALRALTAGIEQLERQLIPEARQATEGTGP